MGSSSSTLASSGLKRPASTTNTIRSTSATATGHGFVQRAVERVSPCRVWKPGVSTNTGTACRLRAHAGDAVARGLRLARGDADLLPHQALSRVDLRWFAHDGKSPHHFILQGRRRSPAAAASVQPPRQNAGKPWPAWRPAGVIRRRAPGSFLAISAVVFRCRQHGTTTLSVLCSAQFRRDACFLLGAPISSATRQATSKVCWWRHRCLVTSVPAGSFCALAATPELGLGVFAHRAHLRVHFDIAKQMARSVAADS